MSDVIHFFTFFTTRLLTIRRTASMKTQLQLCVLTLSPRLAICQLPSSVMRTPPVPAPSLISRAWQATSICFMLGHRAEGALPPSDERILPACRAIQAWGLVGLRYRRLIYQTITWALYPVNSKSAGIWSPRKLIIKFSRIVPLCQARDNN